MRQDDFARILPDYTAVIFDEILHGEPTAPARINPEVPILVRTRDASQLAELKAAGASEVVPELLESSLMLASHALILLGLPDQQVQARVDEVRHNHYRLLHGFDPQPRTDEEAPINPD